MSGIFEILDLGWSLPQGTLGDVWGHFDSHFVLLLSSGGWRPAMFLKILQCTGQPPANRTQSIKLPGVGMESLLFIWILVPFIQAYFVSKGLTLMFSLCRGCHRHLMGSL